MGAEVIVEFVGPNGSGKRTLVSAVSSLLADDGELVTSVDMNRNCPPASVIRAALTNPRLVALAVSEGSKQRGPLRVLVQRDEALKRSCVAPVTLVDEGPRHRLLSLGAKGLLRRPLPIYRALHPPEVVVALDCNVELLIARLRTKPEGHWTHRRGEQELRDILGRYAALLHLALSWEKATVLQVRNEGSIQGVAKEVAAGIFSQPRIA